jgi:hypothetical protein
MIYSPNRKECEKFLFLCIERRAVSSVGLEHYLDRVGVTGSNPVQPTSLKVKYVLNSPTFNIIYIGQTGDLHHRIETHNNIETLAGLNAFTLGTYLF